MGLGFGLGIGEVWTVGKDSVVYTLIGITCTLALGALLRKVFPTGQKTASLIAFGTAICGGSAIAAMAPVLNSEDDETAVALATVFSLNAVALLLFPFIGHLLHLSQVQFGEWAALAIHDTSSVVGAAAAYGPQALAVGTTVKLTRAMWIAPVALGAALCLKSDKRAKIPLFIIGFVAAAVIHTLLPQLAALWSVLSGIAKQGLVVTLFLIGAGLSKSLLKKGRVFSHGFWRYPLASGRQPDSGSYSSGLDSLISIFPSPWARRGSNEYCVWKVMDEREMRKWANL